LGQFNLRPEPPELLLAYEGSNFLLNYSYFSKSTLVTDFLALLRASSKCFLVISGTGSWAAKLAACPGLIYIAALSLASASIESLIAAFAAF